MTLKMSQNQFRKMVSPDSRAARALPGEARFDNLMLSPQQVPPPQNECLFISELPEHAGPQPTSPNDSNQGPGGMQPDDGATSVHYDPRMSRLS